MMSEKKIAEKNKIQWCSILTSFDPIKKLDENTNTTLRKSSCIAKISQSYKSTKCSQGLRLNSSVVSSQAVKKTGRAKITNRETSSSKSLIRKPSSLSNAKPDSTAATFNCTGSPRTLGQALKSISSAISLQTESEIICPSSSESEGCGDKSLDNDKTSKINNAFRRSSKIKQRSTKKGAYFDKFQKVVQRAKADTSFHNYEQRQSKLAHLSGDITKKEISYGVVLNYVKSESDLKSIFDSEAFKKPMRVGSNVFFVDISGCFAVML